MSALTGLKYEHADGRFENVSAEFDDETLAPTYRLVWGVPGRSNALNISARLGLPEEAVQGARDILGASQVRLFPVTMHEAKQTKALEQCAEFRPGAVPEVICLVCDGLVSCPRCPEARATQVPAATRSARRPLVASALQLG